jgi:predicted metal-binding membrane protein
MSQATAGSGLSDHAPRRLRLMVGAGLAILAALAWVYILRMSHTMSLGSGQSAAPMAMPMPSGEGPGLVWLMPMWIIMMIAMMIPSAAPTILLFSSVARNRRARGVSTAAAAVFTAGYVLVWALYATVAAIAQWQLHRMALLSSSMAASSALLAGGLLVFAGAYQWLPLKGACLSHCHSPLGFFSHHWREGRAGALIMGLEHGSYCVGCCWALMTLLFVAGVMNLLWVAAIAGFVLIEKLVDRGRVFGRMGGAIMVAAGLWLIVSARW